MNIKHKIAVLMVGATIMTGGALAGPAGAAKAKSKVPATTVAQVNAAVGLIVADQQTAVSQFRGYYLDQMNTTCQGQVAHAAAVKAMVRPKKYPKATWQILQQGVDAYAKGASECVTTTQYGVDHAGTGPAANAVVDSGLKQVDTDWSTGNSLVNQAADTLIKAKIH